MISQVSVDATNKVGVDVLRVTSKWPGLQSVPCAS